MIDDATPPERALLRSAAAPAAASFLDVPSEPAYVMDNDRFVTAFFPQIVCPMARKIHTPYRSLDMPQ